MSKQPKTTTPTDADLKGNPMIGGSKGTTSPEELEAMEGDNTVEGDQENGTNAFGGIDKPGRRSQVTDLPDHRK